MLQTQILFTTTQGLLLSLVHPVVVAPAARAGLLGSCFYLPGGHYTFIYLSNFLNTFPNVYYAAS